jgi:hypothetical protein
MEATRIRAGERFSKNRYHLWKVIRAYPVVVNTGRSSKSDKAKEVFVTAIEYGHF